MHDAQKTFSNLCKYYSSSNVIENEKEEECMKWTEDGHKSSEVF